MIKSLWLLLLVALMSGCGRPHHTVLRGFYYWKTVYKPTDYERATLKKLGVQKMYLRLFDVDWDNSTSQPTPVAPVRMEADSSLEITPVIFITQRTLARLDSNGVGALAGKISSFAGMICGTACKAHEVQIDCDWTTRTKDVYFRLLTALRQQPFFKGKTLSCTIRMHEVKYTLNAGIPPVDRGLLMCYNMGNMKKLNAENSILNMPDARSYLGNLDNYPLPLDVALPLFRWCLLFRGDRFVGILRDVAPEVLVKNAVFRPEGDIRYRCIRDTMVEEYPIKEGDIIRVEEPEHTDLEKIAKLTSRRIKNKDVGVLFFACDSITLSKYTINDLEALYDIYK